MTGIRGLAIFARSVMMRPAATAQRPVSRALVLTALVRIRRSLLPSVQRQPV